MLQKQRHLMCIFCLSEACGPNNLVLHVWMLPRPENKYVILKLFTLYFIFLYNSITCHVLELYASTMLWNYTSLDQS